jgi:hypothetical protein
MSCLATIPLRSLATSSVSVDSANLFCAECERCADSEARGWRAYLVDADDYDEDEVLLFCPVCSAREFGDLRRGA